MKKSRMGLWAVTVVLAGLAAGCCREPSSLVLAERGGTGYAIVRAESLGKDYDFVVKDFADLLEKATGAKFPVVAPSAAPKGRRIFLGVAPEGYDKASLADQEHCVVTKGDDVYLFGGGANGTRYAAYRLLQTHLGFRFLNNYGGVAYPPLPLVLKPTDERRQVPFRFRYLNGDSGMFNRPTSSVFLFRHGGNSWCCTNLRRLGVDVPPDDCRILGSHVHNLPLYLPATRKDSAFKFIRESETVALRTAHPEYFTMGKDGKRVFNCQYCLSNRGCRDLLTKRILENMRRNPDRNYFDITARDVPGLFCYCPECKKLVEKYGTPAGPVIDYVLELCPVVREKFPQNYVAVLAYRKEQTQPPPKGVERLPDNLIPVFAPIDDNFAKDWNHPSNRQTYEDLKGWCRLAKTVEVWYYPNPYGTSLPLPLGNVEKAVTDLKLMKAAGVDAHLWEHNVGVAWNVGFCELQTYVFARMMNDLSLDWRKLADDFIAETYGAAADGFRAYWLEHEELRKSTDLSFLWNASPTCYKHLTPENLVRWEKAFDAMEAQVKDDPARLYAVRRVRVALDYAVLLDYRKAKKAGFVLPADKLGERILAVVDRVSKDYCDKMCRGQGERLRKGLRDTVSSAVLQGGADPKPLPKDLFGDVKEDRVFTTIPKVNGADYEKDADAAFGVAAVFTNNKQGAKLPIVGAFEDVANHTYRHLAKIERKDVPPRGQYKFFRMGDIVVSENCVFRAGVDDWWDFKADIGRAWEFGSHNRATGWLSLRFEGASFYPEDAGKPDRILCDRAVIIRE